MWAWIGALVIGSFGLVGVASAETAIGKVTFVGTMSEVYSSGGLQMRFRFRLTNSTCSATEGTAPTRWIHVKSGIMAEPLAHNMANARSAYNTLLAAFLSGKNVQVDGVPSCNASVSQTIDLWTSAIGVF